MVVIFDGRKLKKIYHLKLLNKQNNITRFEPLVQWPEARTGWPWCHQLKMMMDDIFWKVVERGFNMKTWALHFFWEGECVFLEVSPWNFGPGPLLSSELRNSTIRIWNCKFPTKNVNNTVWEAKPPHAGKWSQSVNRRVPILTFRDQHQDLINIFSPPWYHIQGSFWTPSTHTHTKSQQPSNMLHQHHGSVTYQYLDRLPLDCTRLPCFPSPKIHHQHTKKGNVDSHSLPWRGDLHFTALDLTGMAAPAIKQLHPCLPSSQRKKHLSQQL